jgi:hypothetical protein
MSLEVKIYGIKFPIKAFIDVPYNILYGAPITLTSTIRINV